MNWEKLHNDSLVVDLHTHPSLKSLLFHRNLSKKTSGKLLASLFKGGFWPFSERITFPRMEEGGRGRNALDGIYTGTGEECMH